MKSHEMILCRFGDLAPKRKKGYSTFEFHVPPRKRGIYCFTWPYIDFFLCAAQFEISEPRKKLLNDLYVNGNIEEYEIKYKEFHDKVKKHVKYSKFVHRGELWCHHKYEARKLRVAIQEVGSWVKIHSDDLKKVFEKSLKTDLRYCRQKFLKDFNSTKKMISDPYSYSKGVNASTDYLEVFIERPNLIRVD